MAVDESGRVSGFPFWRFADGDRGLEVERGKLVFSGTQSVDKRRPTGGNHATHLAGEQPSDPIRLADDQAESFHQAVERAGQGTWERLAITGREKLDRVVGIVVLFDDVVEQCTQGTEALDLLHHRQLTEGRAPG